MSLKRVIRDLKSEITAHGSAISKHQGEIKKLRAALAALGTGSAGTKKGKKKSKKAAKKKSSRTMSAAARRKMSLAAKKRWAKKKKG